MALGVLMPLIAGGLVFAWWRNWLPWRAWLVAVGLQIVLVASGVVALRSGEVEEERVERVVSESLIEAHEEAAEVFVWGSGGAGADAGRRRVRSEALRPAHRRGGDTGHPRRARTRVPHRTRGRKLGL